MTLTPKDFFKTFYQFTPENLTTWKKDPHQFFTEKIKDALTTFSYESSYDKDLEQFFFPVATSKIVKMDVDLTENLVTHVIAFSAEFVGNDLLLVGNVDQILDHFYSLFADDIKPSMLILGNKGNFYGIWLLNSPIIIKNKKQCDEINRLINHFFDQFQQFHHIPELQMPDIPNDFLQQIAFPKRDFKITEKIYTIDQIKKFLNEEDENKLPQLKKITDLTIPEDASPLFLPFGYSATAKGIFDKNHDKFAIDTPVFITKYLQEIDTSSNEGKIYLQLVAFIRGKWKRFIATPQEIFDARSVHQILSSEGVLIDSSQSKFAAKFFKEFAKINESTLLETKVYKQTGWHNNLFVLPNTAELYEVDAGNSSRELKISGNLDTTLDLIKQAWKYTAVRLMIDANLAAPLLELVGCRNFCVNIHGRTEGGKTAAMQLANSIWGSPKWMYKFNATSNSIEKAGIERNSLPLNCNEWQTTDSRFRDKISNEIIHRYGEGVEKGRLNRNSQMRETKFFRGIMLITAEEPIVSDSATGGVKTRIIEFEFTPAIGNYNEKNNQMEVDSDLCAEIYNVTAENFGHIGRRFINEVIPLKLNDIKTIFDDIFNLFKIKAENTISTSHLQYLAILALADVYFNIFFLEQSEKDAFNSTYKCFNALFPQLETKSDASDVERAKSFIRDFIAKESPKFEQNLKGSERYGFWHNDSPCIVPTVLKNALKSEGFSSQKILKELARQQAISYNEKMQTYTKKIASPEGRYGYFIELLFLKND